MQFCHHLGLTGLEQEGNTMETSVFLIHNFRTVTEHLFEGYCKDNDNMKATLPGLGRGNCSCYFYQPAPNTAFQLPTL